MTLKEIGQNVRDARKDKKLSQQQLAELAGTSQPSISDIERGKTKAGADLLNKVVTALGIEVCLTMPIK